MLKRILIVAGFLILGTLLFIKGTELRLQFYIFFPLLLLPAYYLFENKDKKMLYGLILFLVLIYFFLLYKIRSVSMGFFGLGHVLFVGAVAYYWSQWQKAVHAESVLCQEVCHEFEQLKQKHESRMESLHHLEKQVAGLLDLFEIARDFSECLSFEKIAEILHKEVLPEIHFERMQLVIFEQAEDATPNQKSFSITAEKIHVGDLGLTEKDEEMLRTVMQQKQLAQENGKWAFPLLTDGQLTACLFVEGSHPDDLAKFEVLSAYLALQVKKVLLYQTVKELSIRDSLTGLFVRRHFLERFDEELKRCIKYGLPLAVLLLDIDHFKRYNDEYGHLAGDATLKQVAVLLRQNLRKVDIVARYGGEEFIIVIPETQKDGALEVAERIRSNVARHSFKIYNTETRVTVSGGVALFPGDAAEQFRTIFHPDLPQELIQGADRALYRAKEEGRNRVVLLMDL